MSMCKVKGKELVKSKLLNDPTISEELKKILIKTIDEYQSNPDEEINTQDDFDDFFMDLFDGWEE